MIKGIYLHKKGYKRPPRSKEWKDKLSKSLLGRSLSDEHKRKISEVRKGKKCSPETIKRMCQAQKGKVFSIETRKKISEKLKGRKVSSELRKKIIKNLKGRICSIETRKKISEAQKNKPRPYQSGELSGSWRGGITPENHKIRTSLEMKLWKKACMERDNFTDQKTGQTGGILNVHHINNFSDFPELRTSIENGITLSEKSHNEFHKKYGFKNNTREQLEEFLNYNQIKNYGK